jgi:predicted O-methyltransferase YrrM
MSAYEKQDIEDYYESISPLRNKLLADLSDIIVKSGVPLEGNSFYVHQTMNLYPELYNKQLNLFWCGTQVKTKVCEIGFNAGHSTMLMLLGRNPSPLTFTVFDIGHHAYTKPCFNYMRGVFQNVSFEYVEGDSTATMPVWIKDHPESVGVYDVVHVDGGHTENCIQNDMRNADLLVKSGGIVIVDDTNCDFISACADRYVASGKYSEIDVLKTVGYEHRILRKA